MKIICKVLIALMIVNCVFSQTEEESSGPKSFLETSTKGLDFTARAKDQFITSACETQCKKIGGYPCGNVSLSCCLSKNYCESSWGMKTCTVPIHAFIC